MLEDNLNNQKNRQIRFKQCVRGFQYIDTGYNDKYAYGVATQKVTLGRKNKEGNQAFIYD